MFKEWSEPDFEKIIQSDIDNTKLFKLLKDPE